jgi:aminoglycoside 2''-phosphotransferase
VRHFAQISPIPVPVGDYHFDALTGISYEISPFIKGVSFYPKFGATFTHKELMAVAQHLGQFLTTLHSFPLEQAREMRVNEMDPSLFWLYMHEVAYPYCKRVLASHISNSTHDWVRELFTTYIDEIRTTPFQTRVTHADMWVFHIIVDPEQHKLSGIIDFATRIADPANDFKAFEHYGPALVKEVYANYSLPVDGTFEMRRLFYTGHDMVFVLARAIEAGNAEEIKLADAALTSYIEAHPNPLVSSS